MSLPGPDVRYLQYDATPHGMYVLSTPPASNNLEIPKDFYGSLRPSGSVPGRIHPQS
jgi:hypothetical protein